MVALRGKVGIAGREIGGAFWSNLTGEVDTGASESMSEVLDLSVGEPVLPPDDCRGDQAVGLLNRQDGDLPSLALSASAESPPGGQAQSPLFYSRMVLA